MQHDYDVVVLGGGAAGLMAATTAAKRGRKVLLIEHTHKIGEKIRISGGGRCNFTNLHTSHLNYLSQNPHFVKSALAQFPSAAFIKMIEEAEIPYYEKTLGQLFCERSATDLINYFLNLCAKFHVDVKLGLKVLQLEKSQDGFRVTTEQSVLSCESFIVATGGLTVPKIGASDFGYRLAQQFGLNIIPTQPALVPLHFDTHQLEVYKNLAGISFNVKTSYEKTSFQEGLLFTHRGISGPAVLQISSYLNSFSETLYIDLLLDYSWDDIMHTCKNSKQKFKTILNNYLPQKLCEVLSGQLPQLNQTVCELSFSSITQVGSILKKFPLAIMGNGGYNKAEVTKGGVDTKHLSSSTMECLTVPGLFFIGEVVDVTGWLGGYNFQWAWSSGYVAGKNA